MNSDLFYFLCGLVTELALAVAVITPVLYHFRAAAAFLARLEPAKGENGDG